MANNLKTDDITIKLPETIKFVLGRLEENGFSAYAVGGAVRDYILGSPASDWDVTTSALPEQTEKVFSECKVVRTGIKHGTITVVTLGTPVEITTFRKESGYTDNRHPDKVEFVNDLAEDLKRRDFTVNSLAYNEKCGLIDLYGGLSDLENGIIRTVGDPYERFSEDALRILRAVRFSSKLGFSIEEKTYAAAKVLKERLKNVSAERILSEFIKTLCGKNVKAALLNYHEIITEIIPEMKPCVGFEQHSKWHLYDVYEHIVRSVEAIPPLPELRLAMFFHDIAKPDCFFTRDGEGHFYGHAEVSAEKTDKILRRLKASTALREEVVFLVKNHDIRLSESEIKIKKTLNKTGKDRFFRLLDVKKADNAAQGTLPAKVEREQTEKIRFIAEKIIEKGEVYDIKQLKISGDDLIAIGFSGKEIGEETEKLLNACMENRLGNDKEKLKAAAEKDFIRLKKRV